MTIVRMRKQIPLTPFIWNVIWGTISSIAAFLPMMLIQALQYPSLILLPFSRKAFWAYNRPSAYLNWGWWAYAIENLVGTKIEISGDIVPPEENAIVIANHQSMADIPVMLCLALQKKRVGDLKWMVKDELKYIPGIGWGLKFLDAVFLKRKWADDQEHVASTFRRYVELKSPMWLLIFPEGTRANEKKMRQHRATLKERNASGTFYVLPPRPKGFVASVQGLRSFIKVIYDLTIVYPNGKPATLIQLMRGEVDVVQIHVERIMIDSIPAQETEMRQWVKDRFVKKDELIRSILERKSTSVAK